MTDIQHTPKCSTNKGPQYLCDCLAGIEKRAQDKKQGLAHHDPVNHPKHYTSHPSGVECIDITRHENFNIGNAIKYLWRRGEKGNEIQDLEKAVWYIRDEIERLKNGKTQ